jgi:predicted lipid carrier protein YhbT
MGEATSEFFTDLAGRGQEPLLRKARGTLRFEVADGKRVERWVVTADRGKLAVSRRAARADCVVRGPAEVFDAIVGGEQNALTALLRGAVEVEGDVELLVLFQRLFPGPPGAHGPLRGLVQRVRQR